MRTRNLAIGVASVFLTSQTFAANYSWVGGTSNNWTAANWGAGSSYPGDTASQADNATIALSANNPVNLNAALSNNLNQLTVDADTPNASVSLTIGSSASLATDDLVIVKARQSGISGRTATLAVSSGASFAPDSARIDGGPLSTQKALCDFDESFTVSNDMTISAGYAEVDVARAEVVTVSGTFTVDGDAVFTLKSTSGSGAPGQITVGSYVQNGGTNGSVATVDANARIN